MPQEDNYTRARARAEAKYAFFVHAVVYAVVMLLLLMIAHIARNSLVHLAPAGLGPCSHPSWSTRVPVGRQKRNCRRIDAT